MPSRGALRRRGDCGDPMGDPVGPGQLQGGPVQIRHSTNSLLWLIVVNSDSKLVNELWHHKL